MKILMNVEDVALMAVRPSQISLRLSALLDKNRRHRPVNRATKWLTLLLTVAFIPLLAAARAANDSSPEKTVRLFVAALDAGQFEEAARYVDGASPTGDFKSLREQWNKTKPTFSLSGLTTAAQDDTAVVKATLDIKSLDIKSPLERETQTGNIALVRHGAHWLLVPVKPVKGGDYGNTSFLTFIATSLQSPKAFKTSREQARNESCRSNLKQIALGAILLEQKMGALKITPQNFKKELFPYTRTMAFFRCPQVSGGESYSFNGNLTNLKLGMPNAPRIVMFYEGRNGQLDFRHDGKANVAFADGHVQTVSREDAKTLQWKP